MGFYLMEESRNFGPLLPKFNGQETGKFIYLQLNYSLGSLEIISIEDERIILSIPIGLLAEFRKSFDKEKCSPCLKLYCTRLVLFIKFYPVAEKDIIWFEDVIEALTVFKRPKEIKLGKFNDNGKILKMEYERILNGKWRFTEGNEDYNLCPSYSKIIPIPEGINDTALFHASRFRVQNRFPLLSNIFKGNSLIRSGQPLVGLTQKRCVQDEKLIEAIKINCGGSSKIFIVDARPSTSAIANTLMGAGIERLEFYEGSERIYLNLENIHTIRESHDRLSQDIKIITQSGGNTRGLWIEIEEGCLWLDHLRGILEGVKKIIEIMMNDSHVLVHCSDGWDRTSQLISLVQLCLFPDYRTRIGFKKLILKDWLSAGHRFSDRNNHHFRISMTSRINSSAVTKNPWNSIKNFFNTDQSELIENSNEECPIFLQFIEAIIQLIRQFPLHFPELSDEFLLKIVDETYEGNENSIFFGNCEAERHESERFIKLDVEEAEEIKENNEIKPIINDTIDSVIIPKVERSNMILWPSYYKRYF